MIKVLFGIIVVVGAWLFFAFAIKRIRKYFGWDKKLEDPAEGLRK